MLRSLKTLILTFTLTYSQSSFAVIDYCALLTIKNKRIQHHIEQLNKLNELKALVTEAQEVKRMLHRKGQLPGEYDGFDQVLTNMQHEVNSLVDNQRSDATDFTTYTLGTVIIAVWVYKHLRKEMETKTFSKAMADMGKRHKITGSLMLISFVMVYLGYKKMNAISDNAEKVVELKRLIEKLNGLEIKQGEIDFLTGLIEEDREKLGHSIRLWQKQKKLEFAKLEDDGSVTCY